MSINSTLTTIAAAGAVGGLTYWVNEITFSGSGGVLSAVMDASPDLVCVGARTIGASNDGTFLTFNQDGVLQNKTNNTVDGNKVLHANGLLYDADTDAWYTTIFDGSQQLVGCFSGDPSGGYTWLKDLGHGGADTEHTVMQPDGSNIIFSTRVNSRLGVYKIAKSNGAKINYVSYATQNVTFGSLKIAKGNEYTTQVVAVGTRYVSGYGASTTYGNLTTSLGSISSGGYLYQDNGWTQSFGRSEVALDGSGNAYGQWGSIFWSTNSSGSLRFSLTQGYGEFISYAWAETGDYLLALTKTGDLVRINPSTGQPKDGVRRRCRGGDIKPINDYGFSNLHIDEENNIAWYTAAGTNGEVFVIKRPLDSSLDGVYGSFTLSTATMAFSSRSDVYNTGQSFYNYSESSTQSNKTASTSTDNRWSSTVQEIG